MSQLTIFLCCSTYRNQPVAQINSIADLQPNGANVCIDSDYLSGLAWINDAVGRNEMSAIQSTLESKLGVPLVSVDSSRVQLPLTLQRHGQCDAFLTSAQHVRLWQGNPEYCKLMRLIGDRIVQVEAGWLTSLDQLCLASALSYGIQGVFDSLAVDVMAQKWFPATCSNFGSGTSRRDLQDFSSPEQHNQRRSSSSEATGTAEYGQLTWLDLEGLFYLYVGSAGLCLLAKACTWLFSSIYQVGTKPEASKSAIAAIRHEELMLKLDAQSEKFDALLAKLIGSDAPEVISNAIAGGVLDPCKHTCQPFAVFGDVPTISAAEQTKTIAGRYSNSPSSSCSPHYV